MADMPITSFADEEEMPITSFSQEQEMPISSFREAEREDKVSLTRDQILADPNKVKSLRDYMVARKGVNWETEDQDKLFETYMSHMRFVNTNDLRTISEAAYIARASDEDKAKAAAAYNVYDEIAPFWDSGEGAGALYDYGKAILLSPSTYIGAVAGKFASGTAGLAAREALMATARQATEQLGPAAGKAILTSAAKKDAIKVGLASTGIDSAFGIAQDYALQKTMMEAGAQDDYSLGQTAISALGGIAGGALGVVPELRRGTLGVSKEAIQSSKVIRRSKASGVAADRIKESLNNLQAMKSGGLDWQKAVTRGSEANLGIDDVAKNMDWFFNAENPDSLVRIIVDSGADLDLSNDARFTHQIVDFVSGLPSDKLKEINEVMEPAMGMKIGEFVDMVAAGQSKSGSMFSIASQAKKYASNYANISMANNRINKAIVEEGADPEIPPSPQHARYLASLWRRMLVSHPATTAVNVLGWGMASTARSLAELTSGTILGAGGALTGNQAAKNTAKASLQNQVFKLRTLLDPYETREGFEALLDNAPKAVQKRIHAEQFGGIDVTPTPELFGYGKGNVAIKGAETVADLAAKASFIKTQDQWTKAFSGIWGLDKEVRKAYGTGLDSLIAKGEYYKITDDMWDKSMTEALQDSFSKDYTKGNDALSKFARLVEDASNTPYLGFIFPFGRFMNNNLAFTAQYSPAGFVPVVAKMRQLGIKGFTEGDLGEDVGKAIVGTTMLATMAVKASDDFDKGLNWFESEDSEGNIVNQQNLAPLSQFKLLARIGARIKDGEGMDKELISELGNQFGFAQWVRELTGETPMDAVIQLLSTPSADGQPTEEGKGLWDLMRAFAQSMSGQIVSGFTRPLDPANKMVGMLTGNDAQIDRRLAEPGWDRVSQELTRYTDDIFGQLLGENIGTPARHATRPEGDTHDPNAMASMFGRKEVLPKNYTDKLLGMVDRPAYLLDQRSGNPQADRFMNEKVAPILNQKSKVMLADPKFINATQPIKSLMVNNMLTATRKEIRGMLDANYIGSPEDRLDERRRKWQVMPEALRTQAKADLGISTADNKLTDGQIDVLTSYVGKLKSYLAQ